MCKRLALTLGLIAALLLGAASLAAQDDSPPVVRVIDVVSLQQDDEVWDVNWSPDSASVVGQQYTGGVVVWDVESGNQWPPKNVNHVVWSPDGTLIAEARFNVVIRDAATNQVLNELSLSVYIGDLTWSPDSTQLATADLDKNVRIWDVETAEEITLINTGWDYLHSVTWSPEGSLLAIEVDDNVELWDAETFELVRVIESVEEPAWSPDGTQLLVRTFNSFMVIDAESGLVVASADTQFTRATGPGLAAWSPDGRVIATSNASTLDFWDATDGAPLITQPVNIDAALYGLQFSPDGTRLAVGAEDGQLLVFSITIE